MQQQDETVNAAAVVLAAAARSTAGVLPHHHQQQVEDHARAATETRWWSRLKAKLQRCFRRMAPHGHPRRRRIADYASPEPGRSSSSNTTSYHHHTHHPTRPAVVAFAAPPPSPASSALTSESPSPLLTMNASGYSSPATASIFAIGPYALDPPQQPVSPPTAFSLSAGVTEPSTAPLTPQPGSSPEVVPFARLLSPSFHHQGDGGCYQLQLEPGSPIGGTVAVSSPPWLRRRRSSEEASPPSGEFVFGSGAAGEGTTTVADGGDGGRARGASISSVGDGAAAEGGNQQWPFASSLSQLT